jgi:hypothetical protein
MMCAAESQPAGRITEGFRGQVPDAAKGFLSAHR